MATTPPQGSTPAAPGGTPPVVGRDPEPNPSGSTSPDVTSPDVTSPGIARVWRLGRTCWSLIGIVGVLVLVAYVTSSVAIVVLAAVLALFPATLLVPVARWLKERGLPDALAAFVSILGALGLFAALVGAMVPLVVAELPELTDSAVEGIEELDQLLQQGVMGVEVGGVSELLDTAQEQLGDAGELAGQAASAAMVAIEVATTLLLLFVILFFYLKDGRQLTEGVIGVLPANRRHTAHEIADRAWRTLTLYFRGQLTVALVDAVVIGVGLVILGVPLAAPLAVLIFFGGLFPIVGAVATGALAVLVALADAGLTTAVIVLVLVIVVQQLEGNVLEPLILGRAIHLHPLVVLLSITAGSLVFGILGAFLAVPVAAITAKVVAYLRGDEDGDRTTASTGQDAP